MDERILTENPRRQVFSRIGWAFTAILVITSVLQILLAVVPPLIWGEDNFVTGTTWGMWLVTFVPMYLVAVPVGLRILKPLPLCPPQDRGLKLDKLLALLPISYCVMYAGNLIGTVLSLQLSGGEAENVVVEYAMDDSALKILFMVILAPLLEEYICRKQIIDRTRCYGEKTAVVLSALVFGLLHQNFYQFFYAFGLGLVFAYVYLRTGRLRYTVILHAIVNFMGSVLAPWVLNNVDVTMLDTMDPNISSEEFLALYGEAIPGLVIAGGYILLLLGLAVAGLVLLIMNLRKLTWLPAERQLPRGTAAKTVYLNWGMGVYILLCLISCALALL